jgi:hypothetical protein
MRVPLTEFEQFIEPAILRRGRSYFNEGRVGPCEEIDRGTYEAVVAGTEDYTVRVTITNGIVSDSVCDCPYDLGAVCKHIAAVILCLKQDGSGQKKAGTKRNGPRKTTKRKTAAERVDDLLGKVSHDELKQFVRERTESDRSLREIFLSSFAHRGEGESKAFYVSQVKAILRSASGRQGFIDWRTAGRVGSEVSKLLDVAQKHVEAKNYISAVHICSGVMEAMTEALQFADDSDGDIGGNISYACEMLYKMAGETLPENVRETLLDYCLTAFDKKIYKDWDWHFDMLDLASRLLRTDKDAQLLFERLGKVARTAFEREKIEVITYETLKKVRGEKEAEDYLTSHVSNFELRIAAIKKALENKQYEKARSLAKDGIEHDRKSAPGLVREWYEWLLKTAQAEKDIEGVLNYARLLFVDGHRYEQDYYGLMKKHVSGDSWLDFVEALIRDLLASNRWAEAQIAGIYVKEAWWNRLFELVKSSPTLYTLDAYEKYLRKDYASELAGMYADAVVEYLQNSIGRDHYQKACRYLRRIKKLGAPATAETVIQSLRAKYPQRRALLEELEMV